MTPPAQEPIALSALQHFLYCPRQCALIHVEQAWAENLFTAEGRVLHEKAHDGPDESRPGVRITRGMPVVSQMLGISGQCDVVEFHTGSARASRAAAAEGAPPSASEIIPVEYKRGKPKAHRADEVQLCAQALCLEEMLGCAIARGFLFYGQRKRRTEVCFDGALRALTMRVAAEARAMIAARETPPAIYETRKCSACSLLEICLPRTHRLRRGVGAWFESQLERSAAPEEPIIEMHG